MRTALLCFVSNLAAPMTKDLSEDNVAAAQKLNEFEAANKLFRLVTTEVTHPGSSSVEISFNTHERGKSSSYDSYHAAIIAVLEGRELMTPEPCMEALVKLIPYPKIEKLNIVLLVPKNVAARRAEKNAKMEPIRKILTLINPYLQLLLV